MRFTTRGLVGGIVTALAMGYVLFREGSRDACPIWYSGDPVTLAVGLKIAAHFVLAAACWSIVVGLLRTRVYNLPDWIRRGVRIYSTFMFVGGGLNIAHGIQRPLVVCGEETFLLWGVTAGVAYAGWYTWRASLNAASMAKALADVLESRRILGESEQRISQAMHQ